MRKFGLPKLRQNQSESSKVNGNKNEIILVVGTIICTINFCKFPKKKNEKNGCAKME